MMSEIMKSATKIVLLLLTLWLLVFVAIGKVDQDVFKTALLMVLAFYFWQKTNTPLV